MPVVELIRDCPNVGKKGRRVKLTPSEANVLTVLGYAKSVKTETSVAPVLLKKTTRKKKKRSTYRRRDVTTAPQRVVMTPEAPDESSTE